MLAAMCVPVAMLVAYSFWTQNYLDIDKTFTLANYAAFFQKIVYSKLMVRSITISFLCTVATLLLAYPMAYFIAFKVTRNKLVWLILITVPFWTSYLLRVFAWKVILGYNGLINSGLITMGVIDEPLTFILYNRSAVIITLTHAWAAFAILPIYVSLEKIDRSLLEAATDLGDTPFRRFMRVTLPLSLPGTLVAGLLVFIPTVGDYVTPQLVGGTKGIMIGNVIQSQFGISNNWAVGGLAVDHLAGDHHGGGDRGQYVSVVPRAGEAQVDMSAKVVQAGPTTAANPFVSRRKVSPLVIYAIAYLAFLYIPPLLLPLFSFNDSIYIAFPLKGFTLRWYGEMAGSVALITALQNSLKVAAVVCVTSTIFGLLAAKAMTRYRLPGSAPITFMIMLPLVIPGIILGIAILVLTQQIGIPLSLFTIGCRAHHGERTVLHAGPGCAVGRVRQESGRGIARPWRDRLEDVLAGDLPTGVAGGGRKPCC